MVNEWTSNPMFGVVLCIFAMELGQWLNRKTKSPFCNPLLVAVALVIAALQVFHIPLENFNQGGDVISLFLAPATAVLGVSVYSQRKILKQYFWPILAGCLAGAAVSMTSAVLLCKAFGLDESLQAAMMPKSVTTPIAMEISSAHGGLVPVTVAAVIVTGILGAVLSPLLIRLFRVKDPVVQGVAIGASSHALGTAKAVELGELQGAMSGLSIGVSGLITVILSLFV